jgi:hypothetical protein
VCPKKCTQKSASEKVRPKKSNFSSACKIPVFIKCAVRGTASYGASIRWRVCAPISKNHVDFGNYDAMQRAFPQDRAVTRAQLLRIL